jgi:predicted AlkP superfamily pyrophosphatase or phosphodiesterase
MHDYVKLKIPFDTNIQMPKYHTVVLNLDGLNPEVIEIKRNGKTLTFPTWEFWETLERIHDNIVL